MSKQATWGGKRKGAGRKPVDGDKGVPGSVCLTQARWDDIYELGEGNYSLGVRRLLDAYATEKANELAYWEA